VLAAQGKTNEAIAQFSNRPATQSFLQRGPVKQAVLLANYGQVYRCHFRVPNRAAFGQPTMWRQELTSHPAPLGPGEKERGFNSVSRRLLK
jgi:hypothetical protein